MSQVRTEQVAKTKPSPTFTANSDSSSSGKCCSNQVACRRPCTWANGSSVRIAARAHGSRGRLGGAPRISTSVSTFLAIVLECWAACIQQRAGNWRDWVAGVGEQNPKNGRGPAALAPCGATAHKAPGRRRPHLDESFEVRLALPSLPHFSVHTRRDTSHRDLHEIIAFHVRDCTECADTRTFVCI